MPGSARKEPTHVRAAKRHTIHFARSRLSQRQNAVPAKLWSSLPGRALAWLFPWPQDSYPGVKGGALGLLAGKATWAAFKHWRAGRFVMPEWFARVLADMIESRCRAGLEIVQELRAYRVPERRRVGAMAVDPATGQDRRGGRIGKRKAEATKPAPVCQPSQSQPCEPRGDFD